LSEADGVEWRVPCVSGGLHFDGMVVVLPQVKASFMEKILDKEERGAGLSARAPLSHQPKLTS